MFFFISSNFFFQLMVLPHVYCWNLKKLIQTASYILFKEIELLSVFTIFTCNVLWIVCHRNLHQRVSNANLAFWKRKEKLKAIIWCDLFNVRFTFNISRYFFSLFLPFQMYKQPLATDRYCLTENFILTFHHFYSQLKWLSE